MAKNVERGSLPRDETISPSGNVRVLDREALSSIGARLRQSPASLPAGASNSRPVGRGWSIHDCDDNPVGPPLPSRSEALRKIGLAALQGAAMPLTVCGPDGRPTGDRLA